MTPLTNTSYRQPTRQPQHAAMKTTAKPIRPEDITPALFLRAVFARAGIRQMPGPKAFNKPQEEDIAAYDLEVVRTIRTRDLPKLRTMYAEGQNLNACNQFGESLLHMACRRGAVDIVSFLIKDAHVKVDIRDDFGRNPFHDACWTSVPHFDVMDLLLEAADPVMLIAEDVRGNTPFDYARKEHYGKWLKYIHGRRKVFEEKIWSAVSRV